MKERMELKVKNFVLLLQFPHLVFGAVASSAPVRATLDFSAYGNV